MFTGRLLSGVEAEKIGLIGSAHEKENLEDAIKDFTDSIKNVPVNQLFMQKMVINSAAEAQGLINIQKSVFSHQTPC